MISIIQNCTQSLSDLHIYIYRTICWFYKYT